MENSSQRVQYTGRVELGHILQIGALVITMLGSGIASYIALSNSIVTVNASLTSRLEVLSQRALELERQLSDVRNEAKQFSRDISQTLNKQSEQLTDLRVLVAKSLDGKSGPR